MKVFFVSTPRGNLDHIKNIYRVINNLGHTHTSDFAVAINLDEFYNATHEMWKKKI